MVTNNPSGQCACIETLALPFLGKLGDRSYVFAVLAVLAKNIIVFAFDNLTSLVLVDLNVI